MAVTGYYRPLKGKGPKIEPCTLLFHSVTCACEHESSDEYGGAWICGTLARVSQSELLRPFLVILYSAHGLVRGSRAAAVRNIV